MPRAFFNALTGSEAKKNSPDETKPGGVLPGKLEEKGQGAAEGRRKTRRRENA